MEQDEKLFFFLVPSVNLKPLLAVWIPLPVHWSTVVPDEYSEWRAALSPFPTVPVIPEVALHASVPVIYKKDRQLV